MTTVNTISNTTIDADTSKEVTKKMMGMTDRKETKGALQVVLTHADGSLKMVMLQSVTGELWALRYYPRGRAFLTESNWSQKGMFHWIDEFTDEELLSPDMTFTPEILAELRKESEQANKEKRVVIGDLNNYKRE